jgi:hypothetical protein
MNKLIIQNGQEGVHAISDAQHFFLKSFDIITEENGFLSKDLDDGQIKKLREWHDKIRTENESHVLMPTEQDFFRMTLLAVSLWRQKDERGGINYLLGKGAGTEVALLGNAVGRIKFDIKFPYRSHSDFELYGCKGNYPYAFQQALGCQEYYPNTRTKGLFDLPEDLLHRTVEVVDLGRVPVLVPQLELLFLDKYIGKEAIPRAEGCDAELLARQYALDKEKILQYLDSFVIEPGIAGLQKDAKYEYNWQLEMIKRKRIEFKTILITHGLNNDDDTVVRWLNDAMKEYHSLWEPLNSEQIDQAGNVRDQNYLDRLRDRIERDKEIRTAEARDAYSRLAQTLTRMLDGIEQDRGTVESY